MSKQIEIVVHKRSAANPKGGIKVEAHGYSGQGCVKAVEFFTDKLGTVESTETKNEYFQQEEGVQENTA